MANMTTTTKGNTMIDITCTLCGTECDAKGNGGPNGACDMTDDGMHRVSYVDKVAIVPAHLRSYVLDMPAVNGFDGMAVRQGHADVCAIIGHGRNLRDGIEKGWCPRCGEVTVFAYRIDAVSFMGAPVTYRDLAADEAHRMMDALRRDDDMHTATCRTEVAGHVIDTF